MEYIVPEIDNPPPRPADPRERMSGGLLARGFASVDELLCASFGEWPVKGLEIATTQEQRVTLTGLWNMHSRLDRANGTRMGFIKKLSDLFNVSGRATLQGERLIGINRFNTVHINRVLPAMMGEIWSVAEGAYDNVHPTMAHETAHIMQGDHYWRAPEIFGRTNAQKIYRQHRDSIPNVVMADILKQYQYGPNEFSRKVQKYNKAAGAYGTAYLQQGIEMQARLHEIIAIGYGRWHCVPSNRVEFMAAMKNAGFEIPDVIMTGIESVPGYAAASKTFYGPGAGLEAGAVQQIALIYDTLTMNGKVEFWDDAMPRLFADLLEMYGDRFGRERFGYGRNTTHTLRVSREYYAAQKVLKTA